jgi:REP element-mobilizing transposase RayT
MICSMATYTQILYHLVFATKLREKVLDKLRRDDFYRFAWGVLENRKCHLYRIGGVDDHVHILASLHPTIALADLVKELKTASSAWIKGQKIFPRFTYWQEGYGAFTHALPDRQRLVDYITRQEEHHRSISFRDEYRELLAESGLKPYEHDQLWLAMNDETS